MKRDDEKVLMILQFQTHKLVYHWRLFIQLYGSKKENVEVMKAVAGEFFGIVQKLLWDDVLLSIGKLTDPPKNSAQENISIENAIDRLGAVLGEKAVVDLRKQLKDLKEKCGLIKKIRHKRLAHNDKDYSFLGLDKGPLPGEKRNNVQAILDLIKKIINGIEMGFGVSRVLYDMETHTVGEALIWYLEKCGSFRQVRERDRAGKR